MLIWRQVLKNEGCLKDGTVSTIAPSYPLQAETLDALLSFDNFQEDGSLQQT